MFSDPINLLTMLGIWAGIFAALYAVWQQNKIAKELACVQLFLQLTQQYDSDDMQRKRAALADALLANPKAVEIDDTVLTFFENLAHLRRRGLLEDEMTWNFFSVDVIFFHAAADHYIASMRTKFNAQDLFVEFENLSRAWRSKLYQSVAVNPTTTTEFLRWTARISRGDAKNS
ncbi:MAG: hypothetical protein WCT04_03975 [Planctomycetota bacterium]